MGTAPAAIILVQGLSLSTPTVLSPHPIPTQLGFILLSRPASLEKALPGHVDEWTVSSTQRPQQQTRCREGTNTCKFGRHHSGPEAWDPLVFPSGQRQLMTAEQELCVEKCL